MFMLNSFILGFQRILLTFALDFCCSPAFPLKPGIIFPTFGIQEPNLQETFTPSRCEWLRR